MPAAAQQPAPAAVPVFNPSDLSLSLCRRFDQEESLKLNELAVVSAFAHLFAGRRVYSLVDHRDGSLCHGVLRSVTSTGGPPTILVQAENDPAVGRRGPASVHFPAGLNWVTLVCSTRAEALAVHGLDGRETNAAVAYAAANNLPVLVGKQTVDGVRPGPVLLHGATVYIPALSYPVFPASHGLGTVPAAYAAVRNMIRGNRRPAVTEPDAAPAPRPAASPLIAPAASPLSGSISAVNRPAYRFAPTPRKESSRKLSPRA